MYRLIVVDRFPPRDRLCQIHCTLLRCFKTNLKFLILALENGVLEFVFSYQGGFRVFILGYEGSLRMFVLGYEVGSRMFVLGNDTFLLGYEQSGYEVFECLYVLSLNL